MRSKFAILLAIAAVCVTTAWAGWTSESLVTGSSSMLRYVSGNNSHHLVYGTDGVGRLVWTGHPLSNIYNPGVWYNRYNPGSRGRPGSWTADFAIDPGPRNSYKTGSSPCIALDGDGRTIHVVWHGSEGGLCSLRYRKCTQDKNGNDKWGSIQTLYTAQIGISPAVACVPNEPNHVLVCWNERVYYDTARLCYVIRFREYVNGAWTAVVRLDSVWHSLSFPSIAAASNGDVFVAYREQNDAGDQIFVKTRTGGVWGEKVDVAPGLTGRFWAAVTEVNPITRNPHLVFDRQWTVPNGAGEDTFRGICHTYRNASGVWLTPEVITSKPYGTVLGGPTMVLAYNGAAHVVWFEAVSPTSRGIMYSCCSSEGGTWSTPEWLTSDFYDEYPSIAAEEPAHAIHMVWMRCVGVHNYPLEIWWKSNYPGGGFGGLAAEPVARPQTAIELFPNPAKAGLVTLEYSLPRAEPLRVTLLDVSGRVLKTEEVSSSGPTGSFSVDVSGLSAGVYVARLVARDLSVSKMLVVER